MNLLNYQRNSKDKTFFSIILVILTSILLIIVLNNCHRSAIYEQNVLRKHLEKRFDKYMEYKKNYDFTNLYLLYSTNYRKRVSPFEFAKKVLPDREKISLHITSYVIEKITFSNHNNEALIKSTINAEFTSILIHSLKPLPLITHPKERWVLMNGVWYREPKRVLVNVSGSTFYADQN